MNAPAFQPHWEAITPACRAALDVLRKQSFIGQFYLAGGTALALQIGHRISKDLDWFSASAPLDRAGRDKIRRALAYFEDAEKQPMPEMLRPVRWPSVKRYAQEGARYIVQRQREKAKRIAF